jgi:hypothetical protein
MRCSKLAFIFDHLQSQSQSLRRLWLYIRTPVSRHKIHMYWAFFCNNNIVEFFILWLLIGYLFSKKIICCFQISWSPFKSQIYVTIWHPKNFSLTGCRQILLGMFLIFCSFQYGMGWQSSNFYKGAIPKLFGSLIILNWVCSTKVERVLQPTPHLKPHRTSRTMKGVSYCLWECPPPSSKKMCYQ